MLNNIIYIKKSEFDAHNIEAIFYQNPWLALFKFVMQWLTHRKHYFGKILGTIFFTSSIHVTCQKYKFSFWGKGVGKLKVK